MNLLHSQKFLFMGVLALVYGGGMIHASIPPIIIGLVFFGIAWQLSEAEAAAEKKESER